MAWSSSRSSAGLRKAGRMIFSIRRAVSLPPLPWPRRISSGPEPGTGHSPKGVESEDIVLSHGDVDLVPEQVQEQRVRLLYPVDRPGLDREAMIAEVRHPPSVAPGETDGEQAHLAGPLERAIDVGGRARGGDAEHRVTRMGQQLQLVDEDAREIGVVADGRQRGDVGH